MIRRDDEVERRDADRAARLAAQTLFGPPLLVEAGAGTGKTSILVARVLAWCLGPGWKRAADALAARGAVDDERIGGREGAARGSDADRRRTVGRAAREVEHALRDDEVADAEARPDSPRDADDDEVVDGGRGEQALGRARSGARPDPGDRGDDLEAAERAGEDRPGARADAAQREPAQERPQLGAHRREDRDAAHGAYSGRGGSSAACASQWAPSKRRTTATPRTLSGSRQRAFTLKPSGCERGT